MELSNIAAGFLALCMVVLTIWAIVNGLMVRGKYKAAMVVDQTAEAIVNHIYTTYPNFFRLGPGHYMHTVGVIELNVRDIPLLKKAFAKRKVYLNDASPEAAVDGFHMELEFAKNTIGVKAYRNLN